MSEEMTYAHCQKCGAKLHDPELTNTCPVCNWGFYNRLVYAHTTAIPNTRVELTVIDDPKANSCIPWHRDTPTGWTPERAKACYDYCEGVGTALLTPGGLQRLREAHADLQLKYDVLVKRTDQG